MASNRKIFLMALLLSFLLILPLYFAQTECSSGQRRACVTAQDCNGIQKCVDGKWSECLIESIECEYGKKTACDSPKVNGVDCNSITGVKYCNICGQWSKECQPYSSRVECCPGQKRVCDVTSTQECGTDGRWGYCFNGQSCRGVNCDDNDSCTLDKCAMGKCIRTRIEKCCHSTSDCSGSERCIDGNCVPINCGECFEAVQWQCIPKKRGICCNDHWNNNFDSCELDYSAISQRMEGVTDKRALNFFEMGEDAVLDGRIEAATYYFKVAELAAMLADHYSDYNSEILLEFDKQFDLIEGEIAKGNFSAIKSFQAEINSLVKKVKPVEQTSQPSYSTQTPTPPNQPKEVPWLIVGLLVAALTVILIVFLVELRKKHEEEQKEEEDKKKKKEQPKKAEESEELEETNFSDLFG
ncbi:MAG: hypothetical protein QXK06_00285 [Candidatus Diapherotrites archaeon]